MRALAMPAAAQPPRARPATPRASAGAGGAPRCTSAAQSGIHRAGCPRGILPTRLLITAARRALMRDSRGLGSCAAQAAERPVSAVPPPLGGEEAGGGGDKDLDCIALGNICVDIITKVDELPDPDVEFRRQYLAELSASPPPESAWEVGGNANFAIAASRIGLRSAILGHAGEDIYGSFTERVLAAEGVSVAHMAPAEREAFSTLLCFVLVRRNTSSHAFCSRYDFGPFPLLPRGVRPRAEDVRRAKAIFVNGFTFDELDPEVVADTAAAAKAGGGVVVFDAGPRAWTLSSPERRPALDGILDKSDVVLATAEEAEAMTGVSDPEASGRELLAMAPHARYAVVKLGPEGCVAAVRDGAGVPGAAGGGLVYQRGFTVDVADTVGCGDSFASAVVMGLTQGLELPPTLALACGVGAATATGRGAGRNVAAASDVQEILRRAAGAGAGGAVERAALAILEGSLGQKAARGAARL